MPMAKLKGKKKNLIAKCERIAKKKICAIYVFKKKLKKAAVIEAAGAPLFT